MVRAVSMVLQSTNIYFSLSFLLADSIFLFFVLYDFESIENLRGRGIGGGKRAVRMNRGNRQGVTIKSAESSGCVCVCVCRTKDTSPIVFHCAVARSRSSTTAIALCLFVWSLMLSLSGGKMNIYLNKKTSKGQCCAFERVRSWRHWIDTAIPFENDRKSDIGPVIVLHFPPQYFLYVLLLARFFFSFLLHISLFTFIKTFCNYYIIYLISFSSLLWTCFFWNNKYTF